MSQTACRARSAIHAPHQGLGLVSAYLELASSSPGRPGAGGGAIPQPSPAGAATAVPSSPSGRVISIG
jgi:hypothetical protein